MERSLASLNTLLSDPAIKAAVSKLNEAAEHLESSTGVINQAINEERIVNLFEEVDKNLKAIHKLTETLNNTSVNMKLPESSQSLRNAADSVVESQKDLSTTLTKLNRTVESIRIFFDYISQDPSAVIRGKNRKVY